LPFKVPLPNGNAPAAHATNVNPKRAMGAVMRGGVAKWAGGRGTGMSVNMEKF
jgi:hypothetical protein